MKNAKSAAAPIGIAFAVLLWPGDAWACLDSVSNMVYSGLLYVSGGGLLFGTLLALWAIKPKITRWAFVAGVILVAISAAVRFEQYYLVLHGLSFGPRPLPGEVEPPCSGGLELSTLLIALSAVAIIAGVVAVLGARYIQHKRMPEVTDEPAA